MKLLQFFRKVAFAEGLSYLALLFLAMPLKYIWDIPQAVRVVGLIHGVLFILYIWILIRVWINRKWKFSRATIAVIASLVPFGTMMFDSTLKHESLE
tara:strand:+ start:1372 stop:1662 length:291 start_codon:yes stop_codon:yes gene_type:complete